MDRARSRDEAEGRPLRIFVNNFPYNSREEEVRSFFSQVGEIVFLKLLTTPNGSLRGQAILQYSTQRAGEEAIRRFNGAEFNGRKLNVEYSRQNDPPPPRARRLSPPGSPRSIGYDPRFLPSDPRILEYERRNSAYEPYKYDGRYRRVPYADPFDYGQGYPPPGDDRYRDFRRPWTDERDSAYRRF